MNIKLLFVGKTDSSCLEEEMEQYLGRLKSYVRVEISALKVPRQWNSFPAQVRKEREGELILKNLDRTDECILLDERGRQYSSKEFAAFMASTMQRAVKSLVFVVGGPWGFSREVYERANGKISLSRMTFSHQMVRLFFTEQLYRAFTILRGEPYHHD